MCGLPICLGKRTVSVVSSRARLTAPSSFSSGYNFNLVTRVRKRTDRSLMGATVRDLDYVARHNNITTSNGANSNYNLLLTAPATFFGSVTDRRRLAIASGFTINVIFIGWFCLR